MKNNYITEIGLTEDIVEQVIDAKDIKKALEIAENIAKSLNGEILSVYKLI